MIHKFQNIHGTVYVIPSELKNFKEEFKKLISKILEDKKLPFNSVYVKMPVFWWDRFLTEITDSNLKYKEIEIRHQKALIKF